MEVNQSCKIANKICRRSILDNWHLYNKVKASRELVNKIMEINTASKGRIRPEGNLSLNINIFNRCGYNKFAHFQF